MSQKRKRIFGGEVNEFHFDLFRVKVCSTFGWTPEGSWTYGPELKKTQKCRSNTF